MKKKIEKFWNFYPHLAPRGPLLFKWSQICFNWYFWSFQVKLRRKKNLKFLPPPAPQGPPVVQMVPNMFKSVSLVISSINEWKWYIFLASHKAGQFPSQSATAITKRDTFNHKARHRHKAGQSQSGTLHGTSHILGTLGTNGQLPCTGSTRSPYSDTSQLSVPFPGRTTYKQKSSRFNIVREVRSQSSFDAASWLQTEVKLAQFTRRGRGYRGVIVTVVCRFHREMHTPSGIE